MASEDLDRDNDNTPKNSPSTSLARTEMLDKFGHPNLVFTRARYGCGDESIAAHYTSQQSPLYSTIADRQRTVPRITPPESGTDDQNGRDNANDPDDDSAWNPYEGVLNPAGWLLLKTIRQRVEDEDWTDTLTQAKIGRAKTGFWQDPRPEGLIHLNTWNDRIAIGKRESDGLEVETSPLILYDIPHPILVKDNRSTSPETKLGWAYTYSGSLYRLVLGAK